MGVKLIAGIAQPPGKMGATLQRIPLICHDGQSNGTKLHGYCNMIPHIEIQDGGLQTGNIHISYFSVLMG